MTDIKDPPLDPETARLVEEHREIKAAMAGLQQVDDVRELLRRLHAFRAVVTAHFEAEVTPGGFFDSLRTRGSSNVGQLAALEREHWTLFAELDALTQAASACLAGPIADVFDGAKALARHLADHEARETAAFMDALYTDISDK